jgi:hypothetical protein
VRVQSEGEGKMHFCCCTFRAFFFAEKDDRFLLLYLGTSPANSGIIESIFFDEPVAQKITVEELSTPETIKLDLLLQTKTLSEKVN